MDTIFIFFTFSLLSAALHFKLTISFFSTSVILEVSPVAKILLELFLVAEPAGRLRAYAISEFSFEMLLYFEMKILANEAEILSCSYNTG